MTAASSVHSNALNFMSSVQNGVDPRTGLYTIAINVPEVQTNDLPCTGKLPDRPSSVRYCGAPIESPD
jgi:hypothetical protein